MVQVLIVENDPMVAMLYGQYLKKTRRFEAAKICANGADALEFLKSGGAELLLLDIWLPLVDGLTLLRKVRGQKMAVDAIFATAAGDCQLFEEAMRLGAVDYLRKPFTYDRFLVALERYAARREFLGEAQTLSQGSIDRFLECPMQRGGKRLPKGIQERTMQSILESLKGEAGSWMTGKEIASRSGLTSVTVRRYMHYLAQSGQVLCEMHYETGGRPCMRYRDADPEGEAHG